MRSYTHRLLTETVERKLNNVPVVAILGPRQCGKSTLARAIIAGVKDAVYLDLERSSDLNKLRDPEAFFSLNAEKLICLDEIQRAPELFPTIRSVVDENNRNSRFLVLGSASPELIKQSSETLAGRITYLELTPFLFREISRKENTETLRKLWLRGGFPRSYLALDEVESFEWRLDFVRTFLERDIPQLGFNIPAKRMERFWKMCAHVQGQLLNSSKIGDSLGVSNHTIRSYVDLLEQTFILRVLPPYIPNLKKRLVKSPKIYIRDTGLLHSLLGIETQNDLLGHPGYGASWESFAMENIIAAFPRWDSFFYRTASGAEIDLILERGSKRMAIEFKVSSSPDVSRGFWSALEDLKISEAWVVAPVKEFYPLKKNVMVIPLDDFIKGAEKGRLI
ncbi:MAG: ATP-binding protein [Desulfobulbaceae bacterium]|nr:ATP-binding protein [Desulfobulbaceae bacterium]